MAYSYPKENTKNFKIYVVSAHQFCKVCFEMRHIHIYKLKTFKQATRVAFIVYLDYNLLPLLQ